MRKTVSTTLLLIALVISGCTPSGKKKSKSSSQSCTTETSSTTEGGSLASSSSSSGTGSSSSGSTSVPTGEFTVTIITGGKELQEYTDWSSSGGVAINGESSGKAGLEKLTNWCNSKCSSDKCLTKLECTNIYAQYQLYNEKQVDKEEDEEHRPCITLGTQTKAGTLKWTSELSITKVEVTCNAYYKYIANSSEWRHDDKRSVILDEEVQSLDTADKKTPEKTISKVYSTPVNSFTIGNTLGGRIFLDQIKITFVN